MGKWRPIEDYDYDFQLLNREGRIYERTGEAEMGEIVRHGARKQSVP